MNFRLKLKIIGKSQIQPHIGVTLFAKSSKMLYESVKILSNPITKNVFRHNMYYKKKKKNIIIIYFLYIQQ
jgi:hypothetical protein